MFIKAVVLALFLGVFAFAFAQTGSRMKPNQTLTARLLAARKKPADHRQDADDQAGAGSVAAQRRRTQSGREAA